MTIQNTVFIHLDQNDIQTAILDYVCKIKPDLKPIDIPKVTLVDGWKMTVSCENIVLK